MTGTVVKKERESGIEILRIILMLQVIFLHVCNYGEFTSMSLQLGGVREIIYWILIISSRCPVYIFVLITGYFSVTSKVELNQIWKKALKVYLPMLFYSVTITCLLALTGIGRELTTNDYVKTFLPFTSRTWYFMTNYLLVVILSPVVNIVLNKLKKKDYLIFLGILLFIFSVWEMFALVGPVNEVVSVDSIIESTKGRGLYGFLFMYIIGGYLRLHMEKPQKVEWKYLLFFFAIIVIDLVLLKVRPSYEKVVTRNDNTLAIIQGVFLFMFFRSIRFKSKIINRISNHNLGVYMIHEHFLMRPLVWDKIFIFTQTVSFYSSPYYLLVIFGICIVVYTVCALIDVFRTMIFGGLFRIYYKIQAYFINKKKKAAD